MPPFTWLFVSVPGAAEKPYMVEEAVSYNELDYISVGAAWLGSALLRGAGGEGGHSSPLWPQGCQELHGGVGLLGALSTGSFFGQ